MLYLSIDTSSLSIQTCSGALTNTYQWYFTAIDITRKSHEEKVITDKCITMDEYLQYSTIVVQIILTYHTMHILPTCIVILINDAINISLSLFIFTVAEIRMP